ncbi:hypothetical protein VTH06DRAFT_4470 [Thermothelomyces fergusii]
MITPWELSSLAVCSTRDGGWARNASGGDADGDPRVLLSPLLLAGVFRQKQTEYGQRQQQVFAAATGQV